MSAEILIVDDDPNIRSVLRVALGQAGFAVKEAGDGAEGLAKARSGKSDLIVLDIGLPQIDGLEMCKALRETHDTPILFLTARDEEIDRVVGFELGGDDYVSKPFSPRELVARIKAILKRAKTQNRTRSGMLKRGDLVADPSRHLCQFDGQAIDLTAREMALLVFLMERGDDVAPRQQLTDAVYGQSIHVSDRTVDSHLRNLRQKLVDAGCDDGIITVHGVGLRMGSCVRK